MPEPSEGARSRTPGPERPGRPARGVREPSDGSTSSTTRVVLRLFGAFRERAGWGEDELEVPPGTTVRALVGDLRARPGLDALPAEPVVAVNLEYASLDRALRDGDEVALIPPVAGG